MIKPRHEYIESKIKFMHDYIASSNPATGSKYDANSNITNKTITTLENELNKDIFIWMNRCIMQDKIRELFGEELAVQYVDDIESHLIYVHDETSLKPYCVSITMYPFLLEGMTGLGNLSGSDAPKHLRSFCGGFVNLVQYVASQFAGAVATPEFLMYFDYFARKDYGDSYLNDAETVIKQELQGIVYLLNQDSAARGGQSVFWNISTYDKQFFDGLFGEFVFPDMSKPNWETIDRLQKYWHRFFREERKKKLLTFPVVTHAAIVNEQDWVDEESKDFIATEMSLGGEFFIYTSDSADSLSSCCRLRNELADNTFSYSLGAGGVASGSKNVITINVNRLSQTTRLITPVVERVQKYHVAYNSYLTDMFNAGMLPVYSAGYISLDKQYLTIGLNGVLEAAEYNGLEIDDNFYYKDFLSGLFAEIKRVNKEGKEKYGLMFNTEIIPGESLGVKNAVWDKKDGLEVNRDCYNSYFYRVEDESLTLFEKMRLHGDGIVTNLDGGSALHYNGSHRLSKDQYLNILKWLAVTKCNYFCENVMKTACNDCGHIHADTTTKCVVCGSENIKYATRVIGYLKFVENFAKPRQEEADRRAYA